MTATEKSSLYRNIHTTATSFIDSYKQAHATKSTGPLSSTTAPECRRYLAPSTIFAAAPHLANGWTNEGYEEHMKAEIEQIWTKVDLRIKRTVIDEFEKKADVYVLSNCTSSDGKTWPFEFVFMLEVNEDGTKVTRVDEYIDTGLAAQFLAAMSGGQ